MKGIAEKIQADKLVRNNTIIGGYASVVKKHIQKIEEDLEDKLTYSELDYETIKGESITPNSKEAGGKYIIVHEGSECFFYLDNIDDVVKILEDTL
jgi:hypothetical protein